LIELGTKGEAETLNSSIFGGNVVLLSALRAGFYFRPSDEDLSAGGGR
jgi:hypothetical protein